MYSVDLERFWKEDERSWQDNCFSKEGKQVALGIRMSDECVYDELGVKGDQWGFEERERRIELNKRYNDRSEKIVGKRLLRESYLTKDQTLPKIKQIGEVFGGTYKLLDNAGMWLSQSMTSIKELEERLDQVDQMDLRSFIYPSNWASEKKRIYETYGIKPSTMRSVRGPVTLASSLYGETELIYLNYDAKELFDRYSATISRVIIEMAQIADEEAGYTKDNAPSGFSFYDDNCCLLNPQMYEAFGYPVLRDVFKTFSPKAKDRRYQHSDSPMAHLLPLLGKLDLTGVNFGPSLTVGEIRHHLPNARIEGQLAPFTFMNNDPDAIIKEIKRDCDGIRSTGTKGLCIATAGSINNGSSLESMRVVMHAIQEYGQY